MSPICDLYIRILNLIFILDIHTWTFILIFHTLTFIFEFHIGSNFTTICCFYTVNSIRISEFGILDCIFTRFDLAKLCTTQYTLDATFSSRQARTNRRWVIKYEYIRWRYVKRTIHSPRFFAQLQGNMPSSVCAYIGCGITWRTTAEQLSWVDG